MSTPVRVACRAVAERYARNHDEVPSLAGRLEAAAAAVLEKFRGDDVDEELAASTIHFLCSLPRQDDQQVLVSQFPATLRTLLELLSEPGTHNEPGGAFLKALAEATSDWAARFERGRQQREADREAARVAEERRQAEALSRLVTEAAESETARTVQSPVQGAGELPSGWRRSQGSPDEWYDPTRVEQLRAVRKNGAIGYPHFAVRYKPQREVQCILRWGHGDTAVELRTMYRASADEAFDEAVAALKLCADEPHENWGAKMRMALPEILPPDKVVMRNVVPTGIPRYTCTAAWHRRLHHQCTSTPRMTMAEAFAELVERVRARGGELKEIKSATTAEQLERSGLDRPAVSFRAAGAGLVAALSWRDIDGARRECESDPRDSKSEAVACAIARAKKFDELRDIDWVAASTRLMQDLPPTPSTVYFETASINGAANGFRCVLRWQEGCGRFIKGPTRANRREALQAVVQLEREEHHTRGTARRALSGSESSEAARHDILEVLAKHRQAWVGERAALVKLDRRSQQQEQRLRDVTTLLALVDPSRRLEVDPMVAARLVAEVLEKTAKIGAVATVLPSQAKQATYLRTLCQDGQHAGAKVDRRSDLFVEACEADGIRPEDAQQALITLRLVNVHPNGRLTLAQRGEALLLRAPSAAGQSAIAAKLKAATRQA